MYNQQHAQQHGMLNGGTGHRGYMGMGMNKPYAHHQNQQQHHVQHPQHQDHGGHAGNYGHHQHNLSGGGMANTTPHFAPAHLPNGTPNSLQSALQKAPSEHWTLQLQLAQQAREMTMSHPHARNHPSVNKNVLASATNGAQKEEVKEEHNRSRPVAPKDSDQVWTALDCGVQSLRSLSPTLFSYTFLTKLYLNSNKLTYLPPAIGRLRHLVTLDISLNEIRELPSEIGMLVGMRELFAFDNHISDLPIEMGSLYQLEMFGIEGNPLREDLKEIVMNQGTSELIRYLREDSQPGESPMDRPWIQVTDEPVPEEQQLKVLSWNTLCDKFCTQSQYGYTPSAALAWERRREMILEEVQGRSPDIFCMQEVDQENFNEYFRPNLAYNDYKGVFWPKSRAKNMPEKDAKWVDGCATFYKHSKYILLDKQIVDFMAIAINRSDMKSGHDVYNRVMPRDHIGTIAFLENRLTGARIIVANTHVFWDPAYTDVKVVQVGILMEEITKMADKYAKWPPCEDKQIFKYANGDSEGSAGADADEEVKPGPSLQYDDGTEIPLIICGDFNSVPDSGVYNLVGHGSMASNHTDLANRNYGNFTRDGITHPFALRSSYNHIGELDFTNYTPGYTDVIDYIWYSTNSLQVTGLLGNVDREYLARVPGFPNWHFPSDHLALLAEFAVKPRKDKKVIEADFGPQRDRRL
ncbi:hypothetical protein NA57DRAFT_78355 [Rhizodiscina lignyota]|uniref:CCR4-Not complex 3'-5'-exoribonuclease subunit Ccr4 n=1 Tax=Rhizodiscina lignyota TaxID=1504668 RepID=A0A9P4M6X4_9PEZI|nr:hypothetical protein NA57DRAFT_78355 [Rhizodiscina lignyota]